MRRSPFGPKRFVDSLIMRVAGGRGGDGCASFEGRAPGKKSPDGGHGGRGGDVILVAQQDANLGAFTSFHFKGLDGKNGSGQGKTGRRGKDVELKVPRGTVVYKGKSRRDVEEEAEVDEDGLLIEGTATAHGTQSRKDRESRLLADLSFPGARFTIAVGGAPGKGNIVQSTKTDSMYEHLKPSQRMGRPGTEAVIELRLKSIADACLVGYPNAGKSSLLGAVSLSRPKVAPFPFTTLHPYIGYLEYSDAKKVSLADLPGLVDGAHEDKGMGHTFLQHVERTKMMVFVVDAAPAPHERGDSTDPGEDLTSLLNELELYMPGLSETPSIVVVNKMDREGAEKGLESIRAAAPASCENRIFPLSTKTGEGLGAFVCGLREGVEALELFEEEEKSARKESTNKAKAVARVEMFAAQRKFLADSKVPLPDQSFAGEPNESPRIPRGVSGRKILLHRLKRRQAVMKKNKDVL